MDISISEQIVTIQQRPPVEWVAFVWPLFFLLLIPLLISFLRNLGEYRQHALPLTLFYLGMAGACILFGVSMREAAQVNEEYQVKINQEQKTIEISEHGTVIYEDDLEKYQALYQDFDSDASTTRTSKYDISLLRNDGLAIWLGRHNEAEVQSMQMFLNIQSIQTPFALYDYIHEAREELAEDTQDNSYNASWDLRISRVAMYGFGGMIFIAWMFFFFRLTAGTLSFGEIVFAAGVIGLMTIAFCVYVLSTWGARIEVAVEDGVAHITTRAPLWFDKEKTIDTKNAYLIFGEIGPGRELGINVFLENPKNMAQFAKAALSGDYGGHIRWEGLSLAEKIRLFEAVSAK